MSGSVRPAALVTGASSGIGRATALELSAQGYQVFAGVRKAADGEAVQTAAKGELQPVALDVTKPETIAAAAEQIREESHGGGLAALINNAGVAYGGPLEFIPLDDLRRQLEINLIGQIAVTQAMVPLLRLEHSAPRRIVNAVSYTHLRAQRDRS